MKSLLIKLVKYYPVIMNLYIFFMMMGYLTNFICKSYFYTLIGQSFYFNAILFILSINLRFCLWHRILIISMSSVLLMETFYNFGLTISNYLYICIIISILSLLTSAILYYKNGCFNKRTFTNTKKHCKMD